VEKEEDLPICLLSDGPYAHWRISNRLDVLGVEELGNLACLDRFSDRTKVGFRCKFQLDKLVLFVCYSNLHPIQPFENFLENVKTENIEMKLQC
jgi:hypothetical protein